MQSIKQADIKKDTKVFVASDLDVPLENHKIMDYYRLECMLPTLKYIIEREGIPIIAGHIGRPKGVVVSKLCTEMLMPFFNEHLGKGKYELMENLRFDPREELGDPKFAMELAKTADIFVNEVFSTSHRKDASIVGVAQFLPAYAGLRLEQEVTILSKLVKEADHPFLVIIGGAKLEDKKPTITKFLDIADAVLVGGKMALQWEGAIPKKLFIPTDYATDQKDIGKETIEGYIKMIETAKTILWAGPMGWYENPEYLKGSKEIAEAIVKTTQNNGAYSVAGGGDTVDILTSLGLRDKFSFISTGGGAMLEFLTKGTLPGLEALG